MFSHIKELFTRPSGYTIAKSVRLRSSASAYFNRTLGSGNAQKFTLSMWCKLSQNNAGGFLFDAYSSGTVRSLFQLDNSTGTTIQFYSGNGTVTQYFTTNQVFRDPSAWYHLVFKVDTTASTNGIVLYVNGVATSLTWNNTLAQNTNLIFNTAVAHNIGKYGGGAAYFDGYLTEINFIDGQALTPSSFGTTNATTGVWQPAKYTGTYGTNGFYLNFSDNSSNTATTIGKDYSGNGNNWTPNNISVTSGVTYDSMVDSPTVSALSSNYCVMNPLKLQTNMRLTNGNLDVSSTDTGSAYCAFSSIVMSSGSWYAEYTVNTSSGNYPQAGIGDLVISPSSNQGLGDSNGAAYQRDGRVIVNGATIGTFATFTNGDVIGVAYDATNNRIYFAKNNTWINSGNPSGGTGYFSPVSPTQGYVFGTSLYSVGSCSINFGQRPFTYTPPTGFVALNTYNLPASTIKNGAAYMAATLYAGSSSAQSITNTVNGVSFQPDLVWGKNRSNINSHRLTDSVRGVGKVLFSNDTAGDTTGDGQLSSFNSNGWTFTSGVGAGLNESGNNYVAWNWKAGGTSSSNTNGSITSTVSAGATQGFSVVTYTGTGVAATIGHGLGVAPSMVITKVRSTANNWGVYHSGINDPSKALLLDSTAAAASYGGATGMWNNTAPTSTVFSVGVNGSTGASATYVAYCFAPVAGYSAFGSYTGNGSTDGPFVYTGFRPRFILVKSSSGAFDWHITDTSRSTYNQADTVLFPNSSAAESNGGGYYYDLLSNGFKCRNLGSATNGSGATYIFAAFAESPFKTSLAR